MKIKTKNLVHYLIFTFGLVLIVGGIVSGKHGATIIGLIVAAINIGMVKKPDKI